jgi:hypothetical protein
VQSLHSIPVVFQFSQQCRNGHESLCHRRFRHFHQRSSLLNPYRTYNNNMQCSVTTSGNDASISEVSCYLSSNTFAFEYITTKICSDGGLDSSYWTSAISGTTIETGGLMRHPDCSSCRQFDAIECPIWDEEYQFCVNYESVKWLRMRSQQLHRVGQSGEIRFKFDAYGAQL